MQKHRSVRTWYVRAGYVGFGLPLLMMLATSMRTRHPILIGMAVVSGLPFLLPAWKLRAFARTASSDARVGAVAAIAIGWCATTLLWSSLLTVTHGGPFERFGVVGAIVAVLSQGALMGILLNEVKAHKAEQPPSSPPQA